MTLRLILTRHAKSSWDNPSLDDHDRPLNQRGHAAAKAIGGWLAEHDYCPESVISSTARRTAETWAEIAPACADTENVQFTSALYMASPERMMTILQGCRAQSTMLLSHNPGTAMLAEGLIQTPPKHPKFFQYPSAATTVISFDTDSWADITLNTGLVEAFVVPKDLI